MIKKFLSILCCGILFISLVACGSDKTKNVEENKQEIEEGHNDIEKKETVQIGEYTLEKETNADKVIVDNDICTITYKGIINSTDIDGTQIKLNVVNKSKDKIIIQVEDFSANGKMHHVNCNIEVLGEKEADDFINEPGIVTLTDQENNVEGVISIRNGDYETIKKENIKFNL